MENMIETKGVPLTVYGLLARKHGVKSANYVEKIVNGRCKAVRGKAAAVKADWEKIQESFEDWMTEYKADGTMIVRMDDIRVSVYVQQGVARVYKCAQLIQETEVGYMTLNEFKGFLNGVRLEYN
ncbi:MAG: hypothetical protein ACK5KT_11260 [Dysgonomonas sp.]